jgi:hypothetical protein
MTPTPTKPKSRKAQDLLKVLGQKTPSVAPPPEQKATPPKRSADRTRPSRSAKPRGERAVPAPIRGKAIQFYLHEQDQRLIHELSAWLASQRKRINDSLVIKTVLRAAKTGPDLLAAYDAAVKIDGRTRSKGHSDTR